DDDDDDVRISVVEALARQADDDSVREMVIESVIENHERPRVRQTACEILSEKGWTVKGYRKQVETVLPDMFYMNRKGQLLRR
ncbi:MAG TPA: HEAT repeat domain-containing protein, partial [bacterium]|nr:HEAT repeat domain-containing protein [bacterium]